MIKDFFSLALKNLKSRGIRSWLTLLGIFIGITAVVSLISLGNGLQLAVASQMGLASNELITVQAGGITGYGPPGSTVVEPITKGDARAIERLSSVEIAVRQNIKSAKVEFNDVVNFRYVGSVSNKEEERDLMQTRANAGPIMGKLVGENDFGKVTLGYNFYDKSEEWGGEAIIPGDTILINDERFEVIGIREKVGSLISDNAVSMLEEDMEDLFEYGNIADLIIVKPKSEDLMDKTKADIEKLLRQRRGVKEGEENFEVSTPESALATINSVLEGVQIFILIVASISIFIGLIGIINTMTTSVMERKKEIGITKSVGARNEHIFSQFFIESSLLGLIGGLAGAIFGTFIGFAGTYGINNLLGTELVPNIDFVLIFLTLLGSFLIGGIAGIIPAMKAAKQNPVEALRG
ncbi:ABC transporter permease [archaeon]|nr:ABC transporter permease [archaeon]